MPPRKQRTPTKLSAGIKSERGKKRPGRAGRAGRRGKKPAGILETTKLSDGLREKKRPGRAGRRGKKPAEILESNCHSCHEIEPIRLQCSKCGLCFCLRALQRRFPKLYNPHTGWSCPRCSGACQCSMCRAKLPGRKMLIERVEELANERDFYKKRVEELENGIEKYRHCIGNCVSMYDELKGYYDDMKECCVSLNRKLYELQKKQINELRNRNKAVAAKSRNVQLNMENRPTWKP